MPNKLGSYSPIFYASEALIQLENVLGMAMRVHRGYDKQSRQKGQLIDIRKPASFEAQDAPGSTAQDLNTETTQIKLDGWKEVTFALTDQELSFTQEQIVEEHIQPAVYSLANHIDTTLCNLYRFIPWYSGTAGTTPNGVSNITKARQVLFDNKVPLDNPGRLHLMIDGMAEAEFLALPAFSQHQGGGESAARTQENGSLGRKFGFNVFSNQNVRKHTKGTASTTALLVNGAALKGAETINLDAAAVTGTLQPGDSFVIAGNTQRYVVTTLSTAAGNAFANVGIFPKLVADVADNTAVTVQLHDGTRNMAFHRNFAALAMAPLSTMGNGRGADIFTAQDPKTGLTIRARIWYEGKESKMYISLDVLYGVKVLDPNLAALMLG